MDLRDSKVDFLSTKDFDMKLRRAVNASDALNPRDYVTLKQLQSLVASAVSAIQIPTVSLANLANITYVALADIPAGWGFADADKLVWITDYLHMLRWTGSAWTWGPGDSLNAGQLAFFDVDPGTGWKLIDGNGDDGSAIGAAHPVKVLKSDGTTRDITTLDALVGYLKGAAAFAGTLNAAVAPSISGSVGSTSANIGNNNNSQAVQSGTGVTVAAHTHIHADAGHVHTEGSLANSLAGGDPIPYMDALPYIRK